MSSSRKHETDEYARRRDRMLVRSLHARIYVNPAGRLYLVGGRPDFEKLLACLLRLREPPSEINAPPPDRLGFPAFCDGELTLHTLNTCSRALARWRRRLNRASSPRASKGEARRLARERVELERLERRLNELFRALRRHQGCSPSGTIAPPLVAAPAPADASLESPYVLLPEDEAELAGQLQDPSGLAHSPLTRWLARLVHWIAGRAAVRRFLHALAPLARPEREFRRIQQLRGLRQEMRIFRRRSASEHFRSLHAELSARLANLPGDLVRRGGLGARLKGRTFLEHCDLLIERCGKLLEQYRELPARRIPACLAALAACDGGSAELPRRIVQDVVEHGDHRILELTVRMLFEQSSSRGYDRLLHALDRFATPPDPRHFRFIRRALIGGTTLADIAWAIGEGITCGNRQAPIRLGWARGLQRQLAEAGLKLEAGELATVVTGLKRPKDFSLLERFVVWLERFPRGALSSQRAGELRASLSELFLPAMELSGHARLNGWLALSASPPVASRDVAPRGCEGRDLHRWLNWIAHYQRLCGQRSSVPKSVRKLLWARDKQGRERQYLERQAFGRGLDRTQSARLQYLQRQASNDRGPNHGRTLRVAAEACLAMALDALREVVARHAGDVWLECVGAGLPEMPPLQRLAFARWLGRMDDDSRAMLRDVVGGWRQSGGEYKSHLPANRTWLAKARAAGVDTAAWLAGPVWEMQVDDRPVVVSPAGDPHDVFLMGTWFGTCLSLDRENQLSVLANAHDANKQVVVMRGADGAILARQLVTVSENFELLGYCCYIGIAHAQQEQRLRYIAAMARYCGGWARRCGLTLADEGQPAPLGKHFWYDDGTHAWHAAARQAWSESHGAPAKNPALMACPAAR